eukprot:GHRQ01004296.1.p1 GENE.GHRQ01004296.1~~GHRQ01004296.1.p1  ORF type:complete len:216 (+),score=34.12 GHRQ01004296.1:380-1027(+)
MSVHKAFLSLMVCALQEAPPLGTSEEGGVAPICHEMLRHVVNEMHRYERVITHWPLFGPYLEASLCVVLRSIVGAVSRQCGMTRVRGGAVEMYEASGSPTKGATKRSNSPFKGTMNNRYSAAPSGSDYRWARQPAAQQWCLASRAWLAPERLTNSHSSATNSIRQVLLFILVCNAPGVPDRGVWLPPQCSMLLADLLCLQEQPPPGHHGAMGLDT